MNNVKFLYKYFDFLDGKLVYYLLYIFPFKNGKMVHRGGIFE
jgi:hypothetical protein